MRETIAEGARTIDELARQCGVGAGCGGCWPILIDLLADAEHASDRVGAGSAA